MRDLFPTGQTTISQSVSSSAGTSTSHSDNISWGAKEPCFIDAGWEISAIYWSKCWIKLEKSSFKHKKHVEHWPGLHNALAASSSRSPSPLPLQRHLVPVSPLPVSPCPPPHRCLTRPSPHQPDAEHGSRSLTFCWDKRPSKNINDMQYDTIGITKTVRFHSDLFCSSRKRRRRSFCSSTLYLHLYWASRGWGAAVLLCSLDTAKLAERAAVRSSMGGDYVKSIKSELNQFNLTDHLLLLNSSIFFSPLIQMASTQKVRSLLDERQNVSQLLSTIQLIPCQTFVS